jgi:hypothetical protein
LTIWLFIKGPCGWQAIFEFSKIFISYSRKYSFILAQDKIMSMAPQIPNYEI